MNSPTNQRHIGHGLRSHLIWRVCGSR
jgi:hypothetical protein